MTRSRMAIVLLACMACMACAATAAAQPDGPPEDPPASGGPPPGVGDDDALMRFVLGGGVVHQLESNLDGGGSFSVNRLYFEPGLELRPAPKISLTLSIGYAYDGYNFNGVTALGSADPWDDLHTLRASAFLRWFVDDKWAVFVLPTVRMAAESGADLSGAWQVGGFAGFSYRFGERLSIGPGIGILTQIEDHASVFPVILVNWRITDELSLETGRGLGASQGPGLVLRWSFAKQWELAFGGRYERQRYRLDKSGVAPDGVGEESSIPLYGGVTWRPIPDLELTVLGGVNVGGELVLDDDSGNRISQAEYDPAGFLGFVFRWKF